MTTYPIVKLKLRKPPSKQITEEVYYLLSKSGMFDINYQNIHKLKKDIETCIGRKLTLSEFEIFLAPIKKDELPVHFRFTRNKEIDYHFVVLDEIAKPYVKKIELFSEFIPEMTERVGYLSYPINQGDDYHWIICTITITENYDHVGRPIYEIYGSILSRETMRHNWALFPFEHSISPTLQNNFQKPGIYTTTKDAYNDTLRMFASSYHFWIFPPPSWAAGFSNRSIEQLGINVDYKIVIKSLEKDSPPGIINKIVRQGKKLLFYRIF